MTPRVFAAKPELHAPDFIFLAPSARAVESARQAGIPVERFEGFANRTEMRSGDALAALVTLTEDDASTQWLVYFEVDALSDEEKKRSLPKPATMYTSTGQKFEFSGATALAIRVEGPFEAAEKGKKKNSSKAPEKRARVLVNSAYLGLGFDRMARTEIQISKGGSGLNYGCSFQPFTSEQVALGKKAVEGFNLTEEDEKAFAASLPAMMEFFQTILQTPGLDEIARKVVDIPWWSIVRNAGHGLDVGFAFQPASETDPVPWSFPASTRTYSLPFIAYLFGKPALACRLAVVEPRPPLKTTAGVIGLAAGKPDGRGPRLMIRLVASRLGPDDALAQP
jgi:hypothetical protein